MQPCFSAVYVIICLLNQSCYVGATHRIDKRPREHWALLARGQHSNHHLQADYDKHGADCFAYFIIEPVPDRTKLKEREQDAIARARAAGVAYNMKQAGGNPGGYKLSEETRLKQSKAKRGKKKPPGFGKEIGELTKKCYRFISPKGDVVDVRGLKAFAKEHGLNAGNLSGVWSGRYKQHKGWRRG